MRNMIKMQMLTGSRDKDGEVRYPHMGGDYGVEDRFRDRRGREHYDNGRYAPQSATRGTLTWDNTRGGYGGEVNYPRAEMGEPENRQRRDSRGQFRSEMDGDEDRGRMEMHYPGPMYPPPVYEDYEWPKQIGFSAHGGEPKEGLRMIRGGAAHEYDMELDEETAHKWMQGLKNEDGSTGPHWTMEQTTQVLKQKGLQLDPLEFWVAMNAVYSDYFGVAKKMNVNNVDFYVYMAKAFIEDKDSQPNRLARYYEYVAKH